MTRNEATQRTHVELRKHGLNDWSVRLNTDMNSRFLGMCSHRDKCIILSAHHIDIHPEPDIVNTILHEVAHALTPGNGHNDVWAAKAKEVGCDNTLPCSNLSLSPDIIDAIRSGATVEVTFEEHVIRTPKYNITRLQDKCPFCGKVARSVKEVTVPSADEFAPDMRFINLECGHQIIKRIPKGTPFHTFQFGGDINCKHEWDKNNCVKCSRKRLYQYQIEGAQFLEAGLAVNSGAACFDEMGLGKTMQAMAVLFFHEELHPVLWTVKSMLKFQQAVALMNWCGDKHIPQVIRTSKEWLVPGFKHYVVGYDMLVQKTRTMKGSGKKVESGFDITQFDRVGIKTVVLDECQQIKNVDSSRTQMVRRVVKGRKVIPLSGTPWNNRGSELFPVFNMMDPMKFDSEAGFKRRWVNTYWQGKYQKEGGIVPRLIPAFKEYTKDLCIRRERTEVLPELPLVNRTKLLVQMDEEQAEMYDSEVDAFVKWFEEQKAGITGMAIIAMMAKMRHLVALCKMPATEEYIAEFVEDTDRKIVVFAHHEDVQMMLYDKFKTLYSDQMPVLRFVAGMKAEEVSRIQSIFNDSPRAIMVASQLAAGEGLNLQTCCDCVMHERQWNPGKEEQAEGRFIRIGSTAQSVSSVYTHMQGLTAIDDTLNEIVERKRIQFHSLMNKGEAPVWNQDSIVKELAETIVNAHNAKKNRKKLSE